MECGDASGIGLLDIEKRAFDEQRCKLVDEDLFSKLPPLVSPDKPIGASRCADLMTDSTQDAYRNHIVLTPPSHCAGALDLVWYGLL